MLHGFHLKDIDHLPFDHFEILNQSVHYLRNNTKIRPVGYNLLPEKFTLNEMQKLYEAIFSKKIDNRNFRRKIINLEVLNKLDEKQEGVAHKPATYYQFNVEQEPPPSIWAETPWLAASQSEEEEASTNILLLVAAVLEPVFGTPLPLSGQVYETVTL